MFKQRRSLGGPNSPSSPLKQEINQSNNGKVLNQKTLEASVGHSRAMMLEDMYPTAINFYRLPPLYEISLSEFENLALLRLKLLKHIENTIIRTGNNNLQLEQQITSKCKECNLHLSTSLSLHDRLNSLEQRKSDHVSHFILRLAFCRKESLREWFIKQESELFMYRLQRETYETKRWFLESLKLNIHEVPSDEVQRLQPMLAASNIQVAKMFAASSTPPVFYKVPFEQVLDLVSRRQVWIDKGFAYVPESQQTQLLLTEFKNHLMKDLIQTAKALPRLDEEDRLIPILESLAQQYQTTSFNNFDNLDTTSSVGKITAEQVPSLSSYFPPCMKHLQDQLQIDHHLKHQARLQYGLFLKGIGLSVEEALIFWRNSFSKISDERFQKEYSYNVRYNYGLEGKRTSYTPYSCRAIITNNHPSSGDHHGCPFKHFGDRQLKSLIMEYKIGDSPITEILRYKQMGHYQIACSKLFQASSGKLHELAELKRLENMGVNKEIAKGIDDDSIMETVESGNMEEGDGTITIEHPNQYFKDMVAMQKRLVS